MRRSCICSRARLRQMPSVAMCCCRRSKALSVSAEALESASSAASDRSSFSFLSSACLTEGCLGPCVSLAASAAATAPSKSNPRGFAMYIVAGAPKLLLLLLPRRTRTCTDPCCSRTVEVALEPRVQPVQRGRNNDAEALMITDSQT